MDALLVITNVFWFKFEHEKDTVNLFLKKLRGKMYIGGGALKEDDEENSGPIY